MTVRLGIAFHLCALALTSPATAQTFRIIDIDPSLVVSDINNNLVAVGSRSSSEPFVFDAGGLRVFPDLPLRPHRLNNIGTIAGWVNQAGSPRVFRVSDNGTGYMEAELPLSIGAPSVVRLTDSGLALIWTWVIMRSLVAVTGYFLWDGLQISPVSAAYNLPSGATVWDVGEDGTIGGGLDGQPFLQRRGEPLFRPWAGSGRVGKIGSAGHVVGHSGSDELIVRRLDGSIFTIPELTNAFVWAINRSGDFVGRYWNVTRARDEAFLVRDEQVVDLNQYLSSPAAYLVDASDITDSGAVLATAVIDGSTRHVLLLPSPVSPTSLAASVTGHHVSLSWQPSPGATEYIVEAGRAAGLSDFFNGSVGPQPSVAATVPPGRYYVRIRARHAWGVTGPSNEVVIDVF